MKTTLAASAALLMLAVPALAQDARQGDRAMDRSVQRTELEAKLRERLTKADANRDGIVTREELRARAEAARGERRAKRFDALDANRDGRLTRDEFAGAETMRSEGGMRGMRRARMMRKHGAMALGADGRIEIDAVVKRALERFDAADANRDGTLTPEERRAARQERMRMRGGPRG